jgi:hypothetical protein
MMTWHCKSGCTKHISSLLWVFPEYSLSHRQHNGKHLSLSPFQHAQASTRTTPIVFTIFNAFDFPPSLGRTFQKEVASAPLHLGVV